MTDQARLAKARKTVANVAALGTLAFGAAVALSAPAAADPPPDPLPADPAAPADPAPPPPPGPTIPMVGQLNSNGLSPLAQAGEQPLPGALGAPAATSGIDRNSILGQNPVPLAPGQDPGVVPNLNPFNNAYGVQQNVKPAAPGQGQEFDVAPGDENDDVSRREWFGRLIDMHRAGMLKGGFLGQVPQDQLGQPVPGTAPPPGTNIPLGPVQFLPDPVDPNAPPPPPPPG
jgi:hypothetical protein